ncbi:hypothetical protein [Hydrogenophaga sp.]
MSSEISNDQTMTDALLDSMSLGILRDKETADFVDYVFIADLWDRDPRFKSRNMLIGQRRGLFRIDKTSAQATLLRPMHGDEGGRRFLAASTKVHRERDHIGHYPEATQFASG